MFQNNPWSLLRFLKTLLECLSISLCHFSQSDSDAFSQWSHSGLKLLYLRGLFLSYLDFMPLRICLESVVGILQSLKVKDCGIKDTDIRVLLPNLRYSNQLTTINLINNDLSTDMLKELPHHTANQSSWPRSYSLLQDVYDHFRYILVEEFSQHCAELKDTLISISSSSLSAFIVTQIISSNEGP